MLTPNSILKFWHQCSQNNKRLLKILGIFSMILCGFYLGKNLVISHFIQKFLKTPPQVALGKSQATTWVQHYHTIGQFKSFQAINLSTQAPGLIKKIYFTAGQNVTQHSLLVQIEDKVERAQYKLQRADYILQKKLFKQQVQLWQSKTVAQSQYLQAKANYDKARAAMKAAKAHVLEKQIRAPFTGVVGIPEVHIGQYISPGQQHIASLQQINQLYLDFNLPEQYFKTIAPGMKVQFKTQESGEFNKSATIYAIEPTSQQMAHTIWVRAFIENPEHELIPGLLAHVQIPVKRMNNAVTVPTAALLGSSKGAMVYVAQQQVNPSTKQQGWFVKKRLVTLGSAKQNQTLILKGLAANEWIVTSGTQKIMDASWVDVKGH